MEKVENPLIDLIKVNKDGTTQTCKKRERIFMMWPLDKGSLDTRLGWKRYTATPDKVDLIEKFKKDIADKVAAAPVVAEKKTEVVASAEDHSAAPAGELSVKTAEATEDNFDPNAINEADKAKKEAEDKAKAEAEAKETAYLAAIKKGDDNFETKSWIKSKNGYEKALTIKPGEKYPTDKIAEIVAIQTANKAKK